MANPSSDSEKVRLDKWLWAARFFKTRSLATEAISGGHIHVNGGRGKASRIVNVGDELRIRKGTAEFIVVVQLLSDRRGPATVAQTLYEETAASREARELDSEQRRLNTLVSPRPDKRPDKHQRRNIVRFTRKQD